MGTNILIVDDHPLIGWAIKHLVEQQSDLTVCCMARTVREAFDFLERSTPDLIILDLLLEGDSGISIIHRVREEGLDCRILVSSMCDDPIRVSETVRLGVAGFVDKGLPMEELLESIRRVLAGKYAISHKIQMLCVDAMRNQEDNHSFMPELSGLSDREIEIFRMMGSDQNPHEIAEKLGIALKTVHTHRQNIRQKLGLRSMAELCGRAAVYVANKSDVAKQAFAPNLRLSQGGGAA